MNLADVPKDAFDVHLKNGAVVHFKARITIKAKTQSDCVKQIIALGCGRLEYLPAKIGDTWQATFVQAKTFDPPKKEKVKN